MSEEKPYQLQSTSQGFQSRTKDIFANLDSIADTKSKLKRSNDDTSGKRKRSPSPPPRTSRDRNDKKYSKEFKGQESIFRTPNESGWPPSRSDYKGQRPRHFQPRHPKKVPDHVKNPGNYTKYDLSDVSRDQMSDRSNTRAAFDFLRQLKDRKNDETEDNFEDKTKVDEGKISFKKPKHKMNSNQDQPSGSGNVVQDGVKRVMPECVVGQKRPQNETKPILDQPKLDKKSSKKSKKQTIALSHLDDEEDDE